MEKQHNIKTTIPFLWVSDIESSLKFYVDGLGFEIQQKWIPKEKIEWCMLKQDAVSLMLQERKKMTQGFIPDEGKVGIGISLYFMCEDAISIYKALIAKNIQVSKPFVSNGLWLTSMKDPDGYQLHFESLADAPEETEFEG